MIPAKGESFSVRTGVQFSLIEREVGMAKIRSVQLLQAGVRAIAEAL